MLDNTAIVVTTAGELIALTTGVGAIFGELWLLPEATTRAPQPLVARLHIALWHLLGLCVMLFAAAAVVELILRTVSMSGLPLHQAYGELGTVLFKTHYGRLWLWRAAAVLSLMIVWLLQWRGKALRPLSLAALLAAIVIVISLSAAGHGGDDGMLSAANIAASLHIMGSLTWGGAIISYALIVLPMLKREPEPNQRLLALSALRLSTLAGLALALTLFPGFYNAWSLVGSWHGLWTTLYGQLLAAKLILVAAMIAVGAVNRYRYVPSLQLEAGQVPSRTPLPLPAFLRPRVDGVSALHFLRILRIETLLLLAVLGLAAALSQQMPAAHAPHGAMAEHTPAPAQG